MARKYDKQPAGIAYSLSAPFGQTLHIKRSANAWWMQQEKLHQLIACFKIGMTIEQACGIAGITIKQYKYFLEIHPEFNEARRGYQLIPDLAAQLTIIRSLDKDIDVAKWWLAKKRPEEFGPPSRRRKFMQSKKSVTTALDQDPIFQAGLEKLAADFEKGHRELIVQARKRGVKTIEA